jgi:diadenosine tetraphosphate (Ap4A) HIT family hydrolase
MLLLFWIFCPWLEVSFEKDDGGDGEGWVHDCQRRGSRAKREGNVYFGVGFWWKLYLGKRIEANHVNLWIGHLLVTTRQHKVKVADMEAVESREIGKSSAQKHSNSKRHIPHLPFTIPFHQHETGFWLPLLARTVAAVTGVSDYNIVQNNGARAAQVVPHVHFHIIPRPPSMPEIKNKSWTMFGRGQRDDLDEGEGAGMAREMRRVLRGEVERVQKIGEGRRGKL